MEKRDFPPIRLKYKILVQIKQFGFLRMHEEDAIEHNKECNKYSASWKNGSIFRDLSYWKSNMIRHNLDVMHIEKNVFDNIFNTLMCVPNRTKDHVKARHDLHDLGICLELHPLGMHMIMLNID